MKHLAKPLAVFAITVGLGIASINANATTSVQNSSLAFSSQGIATFSNVTSTGINNFNDLYTFTTDTNSNGGASSIASFNGTNFSAAFSSVSLLDITNGNTVVATGTISPSFVTQIGFSNLNSNTTYGLNIVGTVTNPNMGSFYSGSLTLSPIPEPSEYLLIACGLGLIGFIASRRRNDQSYIAAC
jgi:flagellar biosynthesis protein FliQ